MDDSRYFISQKNDNDIIGIAGQALLYAAIQSPLDGVCQLINHEADKKVVSAPKIVERPLEDPPGSANWYANQFGSATGNVLDLMLLSSATKLPGIRNIATKAGALETTAFVQESKLAKALLSRPSKAFALGFATESLCRPAILL